MECYESFFCQTWESLVVGGYLRGWITVDSAVNVDSNLVLEVVVAELLVNPDLRRVYNEGDDGRY